MASLKDIDEFVEELTSENTEERQNISVNELSLVDITGSLGVWGITQV